MSSTYVSIFLRKLCEFVDKLEDRFPRESDIGYLNTAIKLAKKTHPEVIVQSYYEFVYPYRKQIDAKDEKFLLSNNYNDVVENVEDQTNAYLKIDHFKKLFQSGDVDEPTKESIWAYLKLLNTILDKVVSTNEIKFE